MTRFRCVLSALGLVATLAIGASGPVGAASSDLIEVFPGPNAINNAMDLAQPGDVLNIHAGMYPERVNVDVRGITLQSAGDGSVTIDGMCTAGTTVDVLAEQVTIRGLRVIGAGLGTTPIAIDFSRVASGTVASSTVRDTCGNAWYGINVYQGGSIRIVNNVASGFEDAGIYAGDITSTPFGPLSVRGNRSFGNNKGIIVQDSSGATIRVTGNQVFDNAETGIWVNLADGIEVVGNILKDNGETGIEVDGFSDGNLIRRNRALGHTFDLYDGGGVGNCWVENVYVTSFGDISC
jgi:parallel beta-helix repeat protein